LKVINIELQQYCWQQCWKYKIQKTKNNKSTKCISFEFQLEETALETFYSILKELEAISMKSTATVKFKSSSHAIVCSMKSPHTTG